MQVGENVSRLLVHGMPVEEGTFSRFSAEEQVAGDIQRVAQSQILVDDSDLLLLGVKRRRKAHWFTVDAHFAAVVLNRTGENLHQSGLTGAVVADHSEYFTLRQPKVHSLKGLHRSVRLGDAREFDQWRCHDYFSK